ncbi:MAG: 4-(cytidine 5'-diphospho)-2-C-methyl-D-erythritol kinase [Bosea sp.]|jgi:4-diphosphocytidyl-2-C-methyl-D-erythritol kinase|nr:4-(cytidine 5'-diphospho)-2-C-methyl-D-erythritol kinase [Bosea sp. (in: a-proteobacteria)]
MLSTRAPAKVNLNLAVHGRRLDGYHELVSLVAFAGVGDGLTLEPGPAPSLVIAGPFRRALAADGANLVLKAVGHLHALLPGLVAGCFTLVKRLPVASGIGGGSADAAAALRLLARLNGLPMTEPALIEAAWRTGADVPVCLASKACVMSGAGESLGQRLRLAPLNAVLVNPGVAVSTAAVFAALGLAPGESLGSASPSHEPAGPEGLDAAGLAAWLRDGPGNDLEAAACRAAPAIADALAALAEAGDCRLARMSGSGATCLGVYADCRASAAAARRIAARHPGWWVKATVLR